MKDFAVTRRIAGRQVLAYVHNDNDEMSLNIHFRLKNATNVGMKMSFNDERDSWKALKRFAAGILDLNLRGQIKHLEETIKVESTK